MKTFLIVAICCVFGLGIGDSYTEATLESKDKGVVVASAIKGGYQIHTKILKKNFKDGGKIQSFEIVKFDDGPNLVRRGMDMQGNSRTEAAQLHIVQGKLKLIEPIWFVNCSLGGCFCSPTPDKKNCECGMGGNCNFGGGAPAGYDTWVVTEEGPYY